VVAGQRSLSLPQWARDSYDIEAKINTTDLEKKKKQKPENKMLKAMLRSMLEDRCKLVTHWVPAETSGYALVAAKQGPKLKKAVPGEPLPPDGYPIRIDLVEIPGATYYPFRPGDTRTSLPFYNVSMEVLTEWLSESLRTYVVDQTGITGNYDFVLNKRNENEDASPAPDPSAKWDLDSLGLKLVPVKVQTGRLMIDHIEKPSEN